MKKLTVVLVLVFALSGCARDRSYPEMSPYSDYGTLRTKQDGKADRVYIGEIDAACNAGYKPYAIDNGQAHILVYCLKGY